MTSEKMNIVNLQVPVTDESVAALKQGDIVYLNGIIYTGREGVYKRVVDQGNDLPEGLTDLSNVNFHCSPAATVKDDGTFEVGAATATASFRFTKWMERWFKISGTKLIIGKGGMSEETYRDIFIPNGAKYLTTVGYGTGALLGRGIKKTHAAHWIDELGLAQAIWVFEVEKFGPFIVDCDDQGNSLFETANRETEKQIDKLYANLKPAALSRYGETTSRKDEVI